MKYIMRKNKTLFLVVFLFFGFHFQNCGPNCSCPKVDMFFDISGFEALPKISDANNTPIEENDTISLDDPLIYALFYEVDYISSVESKLKWPSFNFSTMSAAYGCSCPAPGQMGSKEEKIKDIQITTVHDYNDEYKANEVVNELYEMTFLDGEWFLSIDDFLSIDQLLISQEYFVIRPKLKPSASNKLQLKIVIELSTNEQYEFITPLIYIK